MLEGLDQVPWAEIEHAYGAATDSQRVVIPRIWYHIVAGN